MSDWGFKGRFLRALELPDGNPQIDELSPTGRARLIYNHPTQDLRASLNNGPYVPLAFRGDCLVSVENLAELGATDDTNYDDGQLVTVLSLQDTFRLSKTSTVVADNITVIETDSGVGRWHRLVTGSPNWTEQEQWYIDEDVGNDEADGATALTPIKTHDELMRRWRGQTIDQPIAIHFVGDHEKVVIHDFYIGQNGHVWYTSEPEIVHTGTLTGVTQIDPTTNQPLDIEDTALLPTGWVAFVGLRIRITDGVGEGAYAWIAHCYDRSEEDARVSPFTPAPLEPPTQPFYLPRSIDSGDEYVVERLSVIRTLNIYNLGMSTSFEWPDQYGKILFTNLAIEPLLEEQITGEILSYVPQFNGCKLVNFGMIGTVHSNGCFFDGYWDIVHRSSVLIARCALLSGLLIVRGSLFLQSCLVNEPMIGLYLMDQSYLDIKNTGVFNSGWAGIIVAGHSGVLHSDGYLYGANNDDTGIIVFGSNAMASADLTANYMVGTVNDYEVGGVARSHAQVPYIEPNTLARVVNTSI